MSIKLAVFDIAGTTLVDENFVARAFQKAFADQGMEISEEDTFPLMGYHKPLAIQMMLEKLGVDTDADLIAEIHEDFEIGMMDFYEYDSLVKPMPDTEEVFTALKEKGIRIALNTGFSKNVTDTILARFQWKEKGMVDDYIASNEVEKGRPYPDMIRTLMQRAGINDPKEVAKIGDTTVDIEEGRNAGCLYVIAVTTGACSKEELQQRNPTHVLNSLSSIPSIFS